VTHVQKGRFLFEERRWQEGLSELKRAERLYSGNFMEGTYDEWSDDPRLSMRTMFTDLMGMLGKYFFDRKKYEVSINYWEKLLAVDDCFEEAYSGLIHCYIEMGKKNEAVRVYHRCEKTLKKEMNLTPSPGTMELYLRLIQ
jgi:two-component SAPR family response regulator